MSSSLLQPINKENNADPSKLVKSSTMSENERRTLKTLQLSSNGTLIGSEKHPKSKIIASKKPLKIFQDKKSPPSDKLKCEVETQTTVSQVETEAQTEVSGATGITGSSGDPNTQDAHNDSGAADLDQEAYDLMVRDPIPESYWRELAEERRMSLAEALAENEILHQSMEELKEENQNLSLLAGQAEHLASVLNDVLGDNEDEESSGDKEVDSPEEDSADTQTEKDNDHKETVNSEDQTSTEENEETGKDETNTTELVEKL